MAVQAGSLTIADVYTGDATRIETPAVVDCGPRLPSDALWAQIAGTDTAARVTRVGDAVAARTVGEAIREGRAAALAALTPTGRRPGPSATTAGMVLS